MRRSKGVTINAIILLVASAAAFVALLVLFVSGIHSFSSASSPDVQAAVILTSVFDVILMALSSWGFVTALGLLYMRRWARTCSVVVSTLICSMIILSFVVFCAMLILTWKDVGNHEFGIKGIAGAVVYGLIAIYCGWWAYFFQTRSVKEQFGVKQYDPGAASALFVPARPAAPVVLPPAPATATMASRRPVSITLIAALFLFGAGAAALSLPLYPVFHTPVPFFGFLLSGWVVPLVTLVLGGLGAATGFGLLKLRMWARTLAIYFLAFSLVNSLVTLLRPGSMARLVDSMVNSQLQFMPNAPGMEKFQATSQAMFREWFHIFMPVTFVIGVILAVVQIWLLVTRKQAFIDANQSRSANP